MKTGKRYLSILLAMILAFSMMSGLAVADDPTLIKIATFTAKAPEIPVTMAYGDETYINMGNWFNAPTYALPATPTTSYVGEQLTWTVSNTEVASICGYYDQNEYLYDGTYDYTVSYHIPRIRLTSAEGDVVVKAVNQDGTISAETKITVKRPAQAKNPVTGVKFTQSEYMVRLNANTLNNMDEFIRMSFQDPNATEEDVLKTWSIKDPTIATISESGVVTPLKPGSTEVTVTVKGLVSGGVFTDTATVKVMDNPVTEITFAPAEYTMNVGEEVSISKTVTIKPADLGLAADDLQYYSDDPDVAYVTGSGSYVKIHAAGPGTANITACWYNDIAGKYVTSNPIKVTVTEVAVEEIIFAPVSFKLTVGDDLGLSKYVQIRPNNASYSVSNIKWYSSDIAKATVNSSGYVTGVAPGEVTITARIYNKVANKVITGTCTVTVVEENAPITSATFTQDTFHISVADTYGLNLSSYLLTEPASWDPDDVEFIWTTSNYAVAAVYKTSGEVYPRGVGEATISLSIYNKTAKTTVAATPVKVIVDDIIPVEDFELKPTEFALTVNEQLRWNAANYMVVAPADASYYQVTLSDAGDGIVYASGYNITAKKPGTTTVDVTVYNPVKKNYITKSFTVVVTENIPLKGISFKQKAYTLKMPYTKSLTNQLKADPVNASIPYSGLIWESSNLDIATVDVDGCVTGKKVGETTITASLVDDEGTVLATASTKVTVGVITAKKIALDKSQVRLYFTSTDHEDYQSAATVSALIQPSNAFVDRVEWETTDASIAIVNRYVASKGSGYSTQIVATGIGVCTVTARVFTMDETGNEVELKKTVKVLVCDRTVELKLNATKKTLYLKKGEEVTFAMEAIDKKTGDPVDVRWSSSKPSIASVDKDGVVTALKAGTAVITATTRDGNRTTATCKITVKKNAVTKITTKAKLTMKVGDVVMPKITVKPATAYNPALKFKSSKPTVVAVSPEGELTALSAGKAEITITAADGSKKTAKITITVKK